jgi:PhoH-like ATPase
VKSSELDDFLKKSFLPLSEDRVKHIYPNQYLTLYDPADKGCCMYGRYSAKRGGVVPLVGFKEGVWGIYPKNIEQQFALMPY